MEEKTLELRLFIENARINPKDQASYDKLLEKFGLSDKPGADTTFGFNAAGGNKIIPKEEDFIRVPFRLLSATIVAGGSWRSTDFSDEKVLKASASKLIGKPLYVDHDTSTVNNNVGVIESAKWSPATKDSDGNAVPAGIDGMLKIDAIANFKIARSVLASPPSIGSVSVTVAFDWEPSHKFENAQQFEMAIGTLMNGKMVTRKATKIVDYYEVSLVWMGADPFAKMLSPEGKPYNVDRSAVFKNTRSEVEGKIYTEEHKYYAELCFNKGSNVFLTELDEEEQPDPENNMKVIKLTAAELATKLGIDALDKLELEGQVIVPATEHTSLQAAQGELVTEKEKIITLSADLATAKTDLGTATTEVTSLKSERDTLKTEVDSLKPKAAVADKFTADLKAEVVRLYGIFSKGKPDAAITALIEKSSVEELSAQAVQYGGSVVGKFSGTCNNCKSKDISFQSSVGGDDDNKKVSVETGSIDDIRERYGKSSMTLGKND